MLVAGPFFMVRCLVGVEVSVHSLDVVGDEINAVLRYVAEIQLIPAPKGTC